MKYDINELTALFTSPSMQAMPYQSNENAIKFSTSDLIDYHVGVRWIQRLTINTNKNPIGCESMNQASGISVQYHQRTQSEYSCYCLDTVESLIL